MSSSGIIAEELAPKTAVFDDQSLLDENDEIQGKRITGYSVSPVPTPIVKQLSAKHKGSHFSTKTLSFAKIEIGVRHLM